MSGARPRVERNLRTIYVLPPEEAIKSREEMKPKPVQIKVGISDGIATEVIEGLNDGDRVVTGILLPSGGQNSPSANPFGGGFPRR